MENLESFLRENVDSQIEEEIIISNRFKDENENVIKWKIKCISSLEDEEIRRGCFNKNNEFDFNKYLGKLNASCVTYPNLKNVQLQDSYKVISDDELLKAMLLGGEYAVLSEKVQEINGFNQTFDDLINTAKN